MGSGTARTSIALLREPLKIAAVLPLLSDPRSGGVAIFVGRVRDDGEVPLSKRRRNGTVLVYEAYRPLALRELKRLAGTAALRFGARAIVIRHRIGTLRTGEPSVIIAVACPHRKEAFAACRFLIDRLKKEVPIWKTLETVEGSPSHGAVEFSGRRAGGRK